MVEKEVGSLVIEAIHHPGTSINDLLNCLLQANLTPTDVCSVSGQELVDGTVQYILDVSKVYELCVAE